MSLANYYVYLDIECPKKVMLKHNRHNDHGSHNVNTSINWMRAITYPSLLREIIHMDTSKVSMPRHSTMSIYRVVLQHVLGSRVELRLSRLPCRDVGGDGEGEEGGRGRD